MDRLPSTTRLIGIGWYFAICIVAGVGGGVALDRWLGSTPWLTLLGLLTGLLLAFVGGYRLIQETVQFGTNPERKGRPK
jgi:F0F1-type ATP synthase assembly protein I